MFRCVPPVGANNRKRFVPFRNLSTALEGVICSEAACVSALCVAPTLQFCLEQPHLAAPSLLKLLRCLRWLTGEHAVLGPLKEAGAMRTLVPFLSDGAVGALGQQVCIRVSVAPGAACVCMCVCERVWLMLFLSDGAVGALGQQVCVYV